MPRDDFPKPAPNPDTWPFWEYCRKRELRIQRCRDCGRFRHHPRPRCPACTSADCEWVAVSGRAELYSYTICHPPVLPAFADRAPYNAVVVKLDEGPFLVSNVVGCADEALRVGMRLRVTFSEVDDELTLPLFEPDPETG